jgi:signal transduction histidine kinase
MPFFTTKQHGTGLGLAICHDVVLHHGGSIRFDSQPGRGTTFYVVLPFAHKQ